MAEDLPLVVTISRQLGSGGALIGQRIASRLGILYLDREIISKAAKMLQTVEENLESRDEKLSSIWQSFVNTYSFNDVETYRPPEQILPTDNEIFKVQSEVILKTAQEQSAVIIGRCGSYILRNHSRHAGIFLHADISFRLKRVQEVYNLAGREAEKFIEKTEKSRIRYIREFTGQDMMDVRNYHLSLDTGVMGFDEVENIILSYLKTRFGDLNCRQ